jgi:DNA-binding NarL/FixJ family response regulator
MATTTESATNRQRHAMREILGLIAARVFVSKNTVKTHSSRLFD